MSDEQLIHDFLAHAVASRATPPANAEGLVAQLISLIGKNSPFKSQAVEALTRVNWPLAVNFLSALTPPGMVFVPAGEFTMGSDENENEKPAHTVWVNSFYLDRAPVTNGQFAEFWEEVSYEETSDAWKEQEAARHHIYFNELRRAPRYWFDSDWNQKELPLVGVNWYEALVYAQWVGKRLPTEAEWEKAARGTDARRYPWGNEFDATRCNNSVGDNPIGHVSKPGQFSPQGDSPYGAQDMAGNVWEWTSSLYKPYPYVADDGREDWQAQGSRVLRGGTWSSHFEDHLRCAHRYRNPPDFAYLNTGLRCAATIPPNMRV
jgi:iron(II)-dependent oxidoreductase